MDELLLFSFSFFWLFIIMTDTSRLDQTASLPKKKEFSICYMIQQKASLKLTKKCVTLHPEITLHSCDLIVTYILS